MRINTAEARLSITNSNIYFRRHFFNYDFIPGSGDRVAGITLRCEICGEKRTFDGPMERWQAWISTLYLLGDVGDCCYEDLDRLREDISDVLQEYIGQPATEGIENRIETHIGSKIGAEPTVIMR